MSSLIKDYQETLPLQFDFTDSLNGETITSGMLSVLVTSGNDASPTALFGGAATIGASSIIQFLTAGVINTFYHIRCIVNTSGNRVLVVSADLQIIKR